jgi:hypothetical protein
VAGLEKAVGFRGPLQRKRLRDMRDDASVAEQTGEAASSLAVRVALS